MSWQVKFFNDFDSVNLAHVKRPANVTLNTLKSGLEILGAGTYGTAGTAYELLADHGLPLASAYYVEAKLNNYNPQWQWYSPNPATVYFADGDPCEVVSLQTNISANSPRYNWGNSNGTWNFITGSYWGDGGFDHDVYIAETFYADHPVWMRLIWNVSGASVPLDQLGHVGVSLVTGHYRLAYSKDGSNFTLLPSSVMIPGLTPASFGLTAFAGYTLNIIQKFDYIRLSQWLPMIVTGDPASITADALWATGTLPSVKNKRNMLNVGVPNGIRTPVAFGQGGAQGVDNALWDTLHGFMWDDDQAWF